jgi:protein TonB
MATANGDTVAKMLFLNLCTINDTIHLKTKTKIIAKHKFDPLTETILIDSSGNKWTYYEDDSLTLSEKDTLKLPKSIVMPSFPGGEENLIMFLAKNIQYPDKARNNGIQGTVYVTFIISKEGKVTDMKILRGVNKDIDKEAMRVISILPQWFPGMQQGKFVKVQYNLPIRFTLR